MICGFNNFVAIVSWVLVLRLIKRCAGDTLNPSDGVLRHSNRANNGSELESAAFLSKLLAIFTEDSALPFDWWWWGDDNTWVNSEVLLKIENSSLENCVPESVTKTSGKPCLSKFALHIHIYNQYWCHCWDRAHF